MHMHCHLKSCVEEFGPFHSFWLFPFERYNGLLGKHPNNNRSIEVQLMRRFQEDNVNIAMLGHVESWPFSDTFKELLPEQNSADNVCNEQQITTDPKATIGTLSQELV